MIRRKALKVLLSRLDSEVAFVSLYIFIFVESVSLRNKRLRSINARSYIQPLKNLITIILLAIQKFFR